MRRTTVIAAALLLAATAACGGSSDDVKPKAKPSTPTTSAAPKKLEPIWGPKLEAAAGKDAEGTSACQMPSSNACARYVNDVMDVVAGLEAAIKNTGREYPKAEAQIASMKDA